MSGKTMEINVDIGRLKELAENLRQTASGLKTVTEGEFSPAIQGIRSGWDGENAKAFLLRSESVKNDLDQTVMKLNETAQTLDLLAEQYRKAEEEAARIASKGTQVPAGTPSAQNGT